MNQQIINDRVEQEDSINLIIRAGQTKPEIEGLIKRGSPVHPDPEGLINQIIHEDQMKREMFRPGKGFQGIPTQTANLIKKENLVHRVRKENLREAAINSGKEVRQEKIVIKDGKPTEKSPPEDLPQRLRKHSKATEPSA